MTNSKIRNFFTWYNTKLDECRVLYADKSEDYLKLDDFNGVDVILIDYIIFIIYIFHFVLMIGGKKNL